MVNNCNHQDKARVNDKLNQCVSCGKLFTAKPPKGTRPKENEGLPAAPEGYERSGVLAKRYGISLWMLSKWGMQGLLSKYKKGWYWEKDVKVCIEHMGENAEELKRTGLVSTRISHRVHHPGLSRIDQSNY